MDHLKNNISRKVFLVYIFLAIGLRFFSFFPSVIDHDESTYLEIARMILEGKVLYVDMVDIKPPGIFYILAFFQAVFGYSIFVLRVISSAWIGVTAFILYLTARMLIKDNRVSIASGLIYLVFISTWSFYGISLTPEIFFNLFSILALYVLLKQQGAWNYLLAGLIAGMGFIVKYLVLFDYVAFLIFMLILSYRNGQLNYRKAVYRNFLAGIGFLLPFGMLNLAYFLNGHFAEFYNIVYLAPGRYPNPFDPLKMLKFLLEFNLLFLPVFLLFYYVFAVKDPSKEVSILKLLGTLWTLMAVIAVVLAGKTFGHYTIQLMLPVSLIAGAFFKNDRQYPRFLEPLKNRLTGWLILGMVLLGISLLKTEYVIKKDTPVEIASYLRPKLGNNDQIFAGNYHHILYYLLRKDSPTKYIHRTLLLSEKHIRALDIKTDDEFLHLQQIRPEFIIVQREYPVSSFNRFIMDNYTLDTIFGKDIKVFALKNL